MMTLKEASAVLGLSSKTASRLLRAIPGSGRKLGRAWRFHATVVESLNRARA